MKKEPKHARKHGKSKKREKYYSSSSSSSSDLDSNWNSRRCNAGISKSRYNVSKTSASVQNANCAMIKVLENISYTWIAPDSPDGPDAALALPVLLQAFLVRGAFFATFLGFSSWSRYRACFVLAAFLPKRSYLEEPMSNKDPQIISSKFWEGRLLALVTTSSDVVWSS